MKKFLADNRKTQMYLIGVLFLSFLLYFLGFNWGLTSIFQPDESKLVEPLRTMVETKTLVHSGWEYPAQVSSKLLAFVLIFVNRFYTMSRISYYFVNRALDAMLATGSVYVTWLIVKKARGVKFAKLVVLLMGLCPIWTKYAKQVTGDIPALFFALLVMLMAQYFLETSKDRYIVLMGFFAACSSLEKWNGAWVCAYIGIIIFIQSFGRWREFIKKGFMAAISFLWGIIIVAPNIITDYPLLLRGVGFTYIYDGTHIYPPITAYPYYFFSHLGIISVIVFGIGIYSVVFKLDGDLKNYENLIPVSKYAIYLFSPICMLVFWIVMTRIDFERWGWGVYWGLILVVAEGISYLCSSLDKRIKILGELATCLIILCFVVGSFRVVMVATHSDKDTRLVGESILKDLGVTYENSFSDYYTIFSPGGIRSGGTSDTIEYSDYVDCFAYEEGDDLVLLVPDVKYIIISERNSQYKNVTGYTAVKNKGKLITSITSANNNLDEFWMTAPGVWYGFEIDTIRNSLRDIKTVITQDVIGPGYSVYDVSEYR